MRRRISLLVVACATLVWSAAIIAAPAADAPRLSAAVYAAGSLICHQRPERSFHYRGAQYPVCARCMGLYLGAVVGVGAWVVASGIGSRPRQRAAAVTAARWRQLLIVVATPTIVTAATAFLGWWDVSNAARAILAFPLGASIAAVITAGATRDLR